ncbi:collagen alpha-1(I) chain-like [Perognathus longimembris pacificus]|uniref:collagen alpha-1(I) chain-like n=1 Tax=Perognathus longimembris pacificus TaxID=214514 RepID=UPI002018E1C3|nr:collagen alpha-1(I) chain-like [Perognathus longimembris pacificus]
MVSQAPEVAKAPNTTAFSPERWALRSHAECTRGPRHPPASPQHTPAPPPRPASPQGARFPSYPTVPASDCPFPSPRSGVVPSPGGLGKEPEPAPARCARGLELGKVARTPGHTPPTPGRGRRALGGRVVSLAAPRVPTGPLPKETPSPLSRKEGPAARRPSLPFLGPGGQQVSGRSQPGGLRAAGPGRPAAAGAKRRLSSPGWERARRAGRAPRPPQGRKVGARPPQGRRVGAQPPQGRKVGAPGGWLVSSDSAGAHPAPGRRAFRIPRMKPSDEARAEAGGGGRAPLRPCRPWMGGRKAPEPGREPRGRSLLLMRVEGGLLAGVEQARPGEACGRREGGRGARRDPSPRGARRGEAGRPGADRGPASGEPRSAAASLCCWQMQPCAYVVRTGVYRMHARCDRNPGPPGPAPPREFARDQPGSHVLRDAAPGSPAPAGRTELSALRHAGGPFVHPLRGAHRALSTPPVTCGAQAARGSQGPVHTACHLRGTGCAGLTGPCLHRLSGAQAARGSQGPVHTACHLRGTAARGSQGPVHTACQGHRLRGAHRALSTPPVTCGAQAVRGSQGPVHTACHLRGSGCSRITGPCPPPPVTCGAQAARSSQGPVHTACHLRGTGCAGSQGPVHTACHLRGTGCAGLTGPCLHRLSGAQAARGSTGPCPHRLSPAGHRLRGAHRALSTPPVRGTGCAGLTGPCPHRLSGAQAARGSQGPVHTACHLRGHRLRGAHRALSTPPVTCGAQAARGSQGPVHTACHLRDTGCAGLTGPCPHRLSPAGHRLLRDHRALSTPPVTCGAQAARGSQGPVHTACHLRGTGLRGAHRALSTPPVTCGAQAAPGSQGPVHTACHLRGTGCAGLTGPCPHRLSPAGHRLLRDHRALSTPPVRGTGCAGLTGPCPHHLCHLRGTGCAGLTGPCPHRLSPAGHRLRGAHRALSTPPVTCGAPAARGSQGPVHTACQGHRLRGAHRALSTPPVTCGGTGCTGLTGPCPHHLCHLRGIRVDTWGRTPQRDRDRDSGSRGGLHSPREGSRGQEHRAPPRDGRTVEWREEHPTRGPRSPHEAGGSTWPRDIERAQNVRRVPKLHRRESHEASSTGSPKPSLWGTPGDADRVGSPGGDRASSKTTEEQRSQGSHSPEPPSRHPGLLIVICHLLPPGRNADPEIDEGGGGEGPASERSYQHSAYSFTQHLVKGDGAAVLLPPRRCLKKTAMRPES